MNATKGNVRRPHRTPLRHRLCTALMLAMAACAAPAWGQSGGTPQAYGIASGNLADALDQLSTQSRMQIIYPADLVRGKRAPAVSGQLTWRQALEKLLAGSGLEWRLVNETTVSIRKAPPPAKKNPAPAAPPPASASADQPSTTNLEAITVTGTRIRGGTTPSPVITIGAENIREEGFSNLGEVIRSIPQNFSGGQNPGVINGTAGSLANQNLTGGSGLNLRGLGPDATLTLLNGRRLSYSGPFQAVDISAIPVEAVDRLEIVPDGASAIYGSDAVGGVGNVVLKADYEGATVGARYGAAISGGLDTREYNAVAGTTWATGGVIATWKRVAADPIDATQRSYTKNMYAPATIYAGNELRSGLISAHQELGQIAELRLDVLRSVRDVNYNYGYSDYYILNTRKTTTSLVSPSIEFALSGDCVAFP